MNKARRDAAGPHVFLVWWVVWNGRYLNLFYCLLIISASDDFFFFSTCCRFFIPVKFVVYLFFNKDEKKDDEDDDNDISGRSGLNLPVWSRIAIT